MQTEDLAARAFICPPERLVIQKLPAEPGPGPTPPPDVAADPARLAYWRKLQAQGERFPTQQFQVSGCGHTGVVVVYANGHAGWARGPTAMPDPPFESGQETPSPAPAPSPSLPADAPSEEDGGTGTATLDIRSIPASKILLDGLPLGSTPKTGISVSAGTHTVTFLHPTLGTQSITVHVKAGETKTAAVKFAQ
jgi:hypothetical protein